MIQTRPHVGNQFQRALIDSGEHVFVPRVGLVKRSTVNTVLPGGVVSDRGFEDRVSPGPRTGYIVSASYQSTNPVVSFSTTWIVPPVPSSAYDHQTVYIWSGLEPSSGAYVLQPVLTYAGDGAAWTIASWLVSTTSVINKSSDETVSPGTTLTGIITLTSSGGGTYNYSCSFDGYPATVLNVSLSSPLVIMFEALEAYGIVSCMDYPNTTSTAMSGISASDSSGPLTPSWTPHTTATDCGQWVNAPSPSEVDLGYRGGSSTPSPTGLVNVRLANGSWRQVTNTNPLKVRMPDGTWRTYGDSGTNPMKVRMPDGTWRDILYIPGFGPLWYRGDDLLPFGSEGSSVTSWPHHTGGFGPTLNDYGVDLSLYAGPPRLHFGLNGQAALQQWTTDPGVDNPHNDSWPMGSAPTTPFKSYSQPNGTTTFCLQETYGALYELSYMWYLYNSSNGNYFDGQATYDGTYMAANVQRADDGSSLVVYANSPSSTYQMVEWRLGGPSGLDAWRINGVDATLAVEEIWAPDGLTMIPESSLGDQTVDSVQVGPTGFYQTNTYELIVFNKVLIDPEPDINYPSLSTVRNYFATRYGVSALC